MFVVSSSFGFMFDFALRSFYAALQSRGFGEVVLHRETRVADRGGAQCCRPCTGRGDGMILIAGTTADANRPYYLAIQLQGDAASKNHDFAIVRNMNAEELAPRLRMLCQFLRFNVKCARRVSLLHRDINAANPCVDVSMKKAYTTRAFDIETK